jgi:hypothetical protein
VRVETGGQAHPPRGARTCCEESQTCIQVCKFMPHHNGIRGQPVQAVHQLVPRAIGARRASHKPSSVLCLGRSQCHVQPRGALHTKQCAHTHTARPCTQRCWRPRLSSGGLRHQGGRQQHPKVPRPTRPRPTPLALTRHGNGACEKAAGAWGGQEAENGGAST